MQGWVQLRNCTCNCNWLRTKGVIVIVIDFEIWKICVIVIVIDFIGVIDVIDSITFNYIQLQQNKYIFFKIILL